jgi:hypothetical protein
LSIPSEAYRLRLSRLSDRERAYRRRDRSFIGWKIVAGVVTLGLAIWLAKYHTEQIAYLLLPIVLLIALFAWHERTLRALRENADLRRYYERGVSRLEDRWFAPVTSAKTKTRAAPLEDTGERFLTSEHPYARDLDLFGAGSVYHLLCTARTRAGRDTLAEWLLQPAPIDEILRRQESVRELTPLLDFREALTLAGAALEEKVERTGSPAESLAVWSESTVSVPRTLLLPALLIAVAWTASVVGWSIYGGVNWSAALILMSAASRIFGSRSKVQVKQSAARIEAASGDIDVLVQVLLVMEQQAFTSEKLVGLQKQVRGSGPDAKTKSPSQALADLGKRIDWLSSADNWFVKIFDGFIHWRLQAVIAIENWRVLHGASVRGWLQAIGEMEALTAIAVYAYEHPGDAFPLLVADKAACFDAEDFAHPLLPRARAVRNSMRLDEAMQLIVISGPNMAGKSTFIRSVGVNAVLAQAGAPVRARRLQMSRLNVAASICILDSLQGGLSRFYAEILRLKDIDALSRAEVPVLFLLDELLSGTNSHDRRIGTESMVRSLVARHAIGLVTTHDLALAAIAENLDGRAANYHFEDRYEDGKLHFEYKLTPGIVQTSNALALMRSIGLDV